MSKVGVRQGRGRVKEILESYFVCFACFKLYTSSEWAGRRKSGL